MAITAELTLTSAAGDLTSNALALSTTAGLTTAGTSTAITQTKGLARTNTTTGSLGAIQSVILYRGDDATTDGANKVYLKNLSSLAAEYYTVHIDGEELGRLYAGDWTFFPWNATAGTKEVSTCQITGTWAAGDSIEFDGVTIVSPGSGLNELATAMDAAHYPNWTTTVSTATVTFTSRQSRADLEIDTDEFTIVDLAGSNATITVLTGTDGKKSASDIYIKPSHETGIIYEYMLIHE